MSLAASKFPHDSTYLTVFTQREEKHLQPLYLDATQAYRRLYPSLFTANELIIETFWLIAKSTSLLITDNLTERDSLMTHIRTARSHFQLLLDFAAAAVNENPRSRSATPGARSRTPQSSSIPPPTPPSALPPRQAQPRWSLDTISARRRQCCRLAYQWASHGSDVI